jgi:Family of unknown function (DUF5317)
VGRVFHLVSYLPAAVFLLANRRLRYLWIVGFGGALNVLAIAANGGVMPASAGALGAAGLPPTTELFSNSTFIATPHLGFLGDVFAIPANWPLANVFSIGDVVIAAGFAAVVHAMAGSRLRRTQATALPDVVLAR